jgi:hypothetical protein
VNATNHSLPADNSTHLSLTVGTVLACPKCGRTDALGELETVEAIAEASGARVGADGVEFDWTGYTEVYYENCERICAVCRNCDWTGPCDHLVAAPSDAHNTDTVPGSGEVG